MDENVKQLMVIAEELEAFKHKVYALLNREKWLDEFIMNNAPCNYNLIILIRNIQQEKTTHRVRAFHDGLFHGIECIEGETQFGFFKSEQDKRPSSCSYIDKDDAERLYKLFRGEPDA